MSRPKSEDKRNAILAAATRVIAAEGLSAATATIAREARVANGSLFNYFETKADLLNALYRELKTEVASLAMADIPADAELRHQALQAWTQWMRWGAAYPDKRLALARLAVSDEITAESRALGNQMFAGVAELLERSRAAGPFKDQPLAFLLALVEAWAGATMDFMIQHPAEAETYGRAGFEALWRAIA